MAQPPAMLDIRAALAALRVVIAGNQSTRAGELVRSLSLPADAIATSGEWGVAKPDSEFFTRVIELAAAAPDRTVYVGDYPTNDCAPAAAAGLRTAHVRRGPFGHLWAASPEAAAADWRIHSLTELPGLLLG